MRTSLAVAVRIIVQAHLDEVVEAIGAALRKRRVTRSRMMPFVVSMRTRYILGAGCDHSESCGSCSARERSSDASPCEAATSSVVTAMKTDKRTNRVISTRTPALRLAHSISFRVADYS